MADEIDDSRFKSEMMRLMHNVIGRFTEIDNRFDKLDGRFDQVDEKLVSLQSDVRTLTGQLNDVGVLAIKDSGRIDDHEKRISDVEANIH